MADLAEQAGQAQAAEGITQPEAQPSDPLESFDPGIADHFKPVDSTKPESTVDRPEVKAAEVQPELLAGKYKTQEDLIDGYLNLQKKIGSFVGAPEKYTLDNVNKDIDQKFISDDPHLNQFMQLAKENNMSQEMFDKTLNMYRDYVLSMMPKPGAEKAKLGDDADSKLRSLKMWADSNLSPEGKNRFKKYMGDDVSEADLFLLMDEMRSVMEPIEGPTKFDAAKTAQRTIDEIKQEISDNWDKYQTNMIYRQEKLRQLQEAFDYKKRHGS